MTGGLESQAYFAPVPPLGHVRLGFSPAAEFTQKQIVAMGASPHRTKNPSVRIGSYAPEAGRGNLLSILNHATHLRWVGYNLLYPCKCCLTPTHPTRVLRNREGACNRGDLPFIHLIP